MRDDGKILLYFCHNEKKQGRGEVTNWPGTLRLNITHLRESRHNMARVRYDFWFWFNKHLWHGYTIGDNTQIAHCKQTKEKAA